MFKLAVFLLLIGTNVTNTYNLANRKNSKVCTSTICAHEATIMKRYLDERIQPCENFFEFACGGFVRNTVLPEDKGVYHSFGQIQDKVNEQLNSVLNEAEHPHEPNAFKLAKIFQKSCMNQNRRESEGLACSKHFTQFYVYRQINKFPEIVQALHR